MGDELDDLTKDQTDEPAPLSEHEKAMRGLLGTPKDEVEGQERRGRKQRQRQRQRGRKGQ